MVVLSASLVALLSFAGSTDHEGLAFCSCPENSQFDQTLPMSHPVNRCATQQANGVSWISWFSNSSKSKQFHYLDLLELLSRDSDPEQNAG